MWEISLHFQGTCLWAFLRWRWFLSHGRLPKNLKHTRWTQCYLWGKIAAFDLILRMKKKHLIIRIKNICFLIINKHNFFSLPFYYLSKFADPPLMPSPPPHIWLKSTFLKFKRLPSLEILFWNWLKEMGFCA